MKNKANIPLLSDRVPTTPQFHHLKDQDLLTFQATPRRRLPSSHRGTNSSRNKCHSNLTLSTTSCSSNQLKKCFHPYETSGMSSTDGLDYCKQQSDYQTHRILTERSENIKSSYFGFPKKNQSKTQEFCSEVSENNQIRKSSFIPRKILSNIENHRVHPKQQQDDHPSYLLSLSNYFSSQKQGRTILKNFQISDFQLALYRDEDNFGKLYPARHLATGFLCCIKFIRKNQAKENLKKIIEDIKIQIMCQSRYSVQIYGIFDDIQNIYLIMEYHEDSKLGMKAALREGLPPKEAIQCIMALTKSIEPLHQKKIGFGPLFPEHVAAYNDTFKLSRSSYFIIDRNLSRSASSASSYFYEKCPYEFPSGEQFSKDLIYLTFFLQELLVGRKTQRRNSRKSSIFCSTTKSSHTKELQKQKIHPKIFQQIFQKTLWTQEIRQIKQYIESLKELSKFFNQN